MAVSSARPLSPGIHRAVAAACQGPWQRHRPRVAVANALPLRAAASSATTTTASPPDDHDPPWLCPVCGGPLRPGPRPPTSRRAPLLCPAGHSHDVAREGHVFLLPTGRKKRESAGPPGDAEAQVKARRAFFDGGHYDRVTAAAADAVLDALADRADSGPRPAVLDAGCGEGAYIGALATALASSTSSPSSATAAAPPSLLGVDVSKPAIRLASARHGGVARFAVASSFALPVGPACLDAVLVAMAPVPPPAELARVLRPRTGRLVVVRPAPRHLDGLKRAVYGAGARFDEEEEEEGGGQPGPGTRLLVRRARLTYPLALAGPAARDLLAMTPFAWSAGREVGDRWAQQEGLVLETAVDVFVETWGVG